MGYVFDFKDALAYEKWFFSQGNRAAAALEARFIFDMLNPLPGRTLIDIGCGTGARLTEFVERGIDVTGLDPSCYMLDIARGKFNDRVEFFRDFGESLPFEDNSFHYAALTTTLEYVDNPARVIEEACRVARDKVFIGIYNRYNIKSVQRRVKAALSESIYRHARFYSVWEIKHIIHRVIGDVPVTWRTVSRLPGAFGKYESLPVIRKSPFGAFAGIVIKPVPRFRTTPLALKYNAKHSTAPGI
jgi:SAM-dependent methyltransferase